MLLRVGHDYARFQRNYHVFVIQLSAFMYDYYSAILCCAWHDVSLLLRVIHTPRNF